MSVANNLLNDKQYIEAKSTIDQVFSGAQNDQNARAWYTKGRIYHEILNSDISSLNKFKTDRTDFAAEVALAYNKTKALSEPSNNFFILASNQLEVLWRNGINQGYEQYQQGKFDQAAKSFEVSQVAKPQDTTAYVYAGLSAQNAGSYKKAIDYYLAMKPFSRLSKNVYNYLIYCKQAMNVPLEERLDMIEEALFEYPEHLPYVVEEVRALIRLNKFEEAESRLNTVLARNPNQYELRLRRADLFDRIFKESYLQGKPERSERYFEMASEDYEIYLDKYPEDFTANYNYAVMINEQANRVYVRINLMNEEEYLISGEGMEEIGHNWTRKALPYMERCHKLNAKDEGAIKALKVFYERLKMTEKLAKLNGN